MPLESCCMVRRPYVRLRGRVAVHTGHFVCLLVVIWWTCSVEGGMWSGVSGGTRMRARGADGRETFVCTSSSSTHLLWKAISVLVQAANMLCISPDGTVKPADSSSWPLVELRDAAQGNGSRIFVQVQAIAPSSLQFLNVSMLDGVADKIARMVAAVGYDGFQLDIEGLKPDAKASEGSTTLFSSSNKNLDGTVTV